MSSLKPKTNSAPNARGKRSHFTIDEYPMSKKASAVRHLRLMLSRWLNGRANGRELDEAFTIFEQARDEPR